MAATSEKMKRWTCPSDRVLTLRSKLNSGWSVHSQDYFQKPEPILDPELRYIENVMERARQIDSNERERIRRMVSRLDNMKRNAVGDGVRNCSMCGKTFGIFRMSTVNCSDCLMAVCQKCRIDIHYGSQEVFVLCKICAEKREVWKKSGSWFYGKFLPPVELDEQKVKSFQKFGLPSSPRAFNTWEHRKHDIVRLESFEAPEENYNERPLIKNWAVSSSPDLSTLDDDKEIAESEKHIRTSSECLGDDHLGMDCLSTPSITTNLSSSCPALQIADVVTNNNCYKTAAAYTKRNKPVFSSRRFLAPARILIGKIT